MNTFPLVEPIIQAPDYTN